MRGEKDERRGQQSQRSLTLLFYRRGAVTFRGTVGGGLLQANTNRQAAKADLFAFPTSHPFRKSRSPGLKGEHLMECNALRVDQSLIIAVRC